MRGRQGTMFGLNHWIGLAVVPLLLALMGAGSGIAQDVESLCATVKIEIAQELTLERQAFDAHMRINNGLTHISLEQVAIAVNFADEDGNPVLASADPTDTTASFYIREDSLENIAAVDGTGTVAPATSADVHWLIIPAPGAANGVPQGTLYYVGATLSYTMGGEAEVMEVSPDYIYVKPMPELVLDYFLPGDVYGDDAFTTDIEPPIPFSLGVRVSNTGTGTARTLAIDSGQPKIIENELGLLVGFNIEGSEVNGASATNSLRVDFGDIPPGSAGVARWWMTCSLSGRFTEFTAEYTHSNELGGALTSLLDDPVTHLLVRDVRVDLPGRDAIRDFLADDAGVLRVYESEGIDTVVDDVSASASLTPSGGDTFALTLPVATGFSHAKFIDPYVGAMELREVVRSDGKRISAANAWLSKRRAEDPDPETGIKPWQYFFHLFDANSTGSYTALFAAPAAQPNPPVLQFIADQTLAEAGTVVFVVHATDADGTIPVLTAAPLPVGASFVDRGDGTADFSWTPAEGQSGSYGITFRASDGALEDTQVARLTIHPIWDTDGDGMADAWELEHFGDLSRNGSGDWDGDGISDLDEFLAGTDPDTGFAPTIPVVQAPVSGAEVATLLPELVVHNSTDRDGDPVTYAFELYGEGDLAAPIAVATDVPEVADTTSWMVPFELSDNAGYVWRVQAMDARRSSQWAYGGFFVNTANDAPNNFAISAPADGTTVGSVAPVLQVTNSVDADGDTLAYGFTVSEDAGMTLPVAFISGLAEGPTGTTSWAVDTPLANGVTYFWQAVATDEHGASTASPVGSFTVDAANQAPSAPVASAPENGTEVATPLLTLVVDNAADADGDPLTYTFEIDTVPTFDSPARQAVSGVVEGAGSTSWDVPAALPDDTRHYWRARAGDGSAEGAWTEASSVFVNTANDAPSAPTLYNPADNGEVTTRTPALVVNAATDSDGDALTYEMEVYADAAFTDLVAFAADQGAAWTSSELANDRTYHWRARAVDEHGLAGDWMPTATFFVNENAYNEPPTVAVTVPGVGGVLTNSDMVAIAWTDADPDSNAAVSLYFDADAAGYDGSLIVAGIAEDDAANTYVWDVTTLADGTYFVYAVIEDELASAAAYGVGAITIDRAPPTTVASPAGGAFAVPQIVVLTADEPAAIYYTTDGSSPSTSSPVYSDPLTIDVDTVLSFAAVDPAGNAEAVQGETYVIDTEPPVVSITSPTGGMTDDSTPLLVFTASEGDAVVFVDGGPVAKVSGDELDSLADGPHSVRVEATDAAGNLGFSEVTFAVDTAAPTELLVQVDTSQGRNLTGVRVYAFTEAGAYTGKNATTDSAGTAHFVPAEFVDGSYKFRVDYLGYQFWSNAVLVPGTALVPVLIAEEGASILVTQGGTPEAGVRVYLFTAGGAYMGLYATTDADGFVAFDLPVGLDYQVRADVLGSQYWSRVISAAAGVPNTFPVDSGGGLLTATVDRGDGTPLVGARVYLFTAGDSYLGRSGITDGAGQVAFDVSSAAYKVRCDYLGYQFWSDTITVASDASLALSIPHRDVAITVMGDYAGAVEPKVAIPVYLFTEAGSYLGITVATDAAGVVLFSLPERAYKVRVDVLTFQYWSQSFVWSDPNVTIPEGIAEVQVTQDEVLLEGVPVYAYTQVGAYLNLNETTDGVGVVSFRLPAETYRFRADHLGNQYWSGDFALAAGEINAIAVPTGGGAFTFRVTDLSGTPLEGVPCFLFDDAGTYLAQNRLTNALGETGFELSDGSYQFRIDYKGYPFWSAVITVVAPGGPFDQHLVIDQGEVVTTVQRDYAGALLPVAGTPAYLFTEAGVYLNEQHPTDASGQARFVVPDESYKVRADYFGVQYWSDPFVAVDPTITIPEGQVEVTVTLTGTPLSGVSVYAFSAGGTYLGLQERTDEQGAAYFWLPVGTYRFRADVQGSQYFANAAIEPHLVNPVALSTGGGSIELTLDDGTGAPLVGLPVYVFTDAGSYIGVHETTDTLGAVAFTLSDGDYEFRADYLGYSFWSGVRSIPTETTYTFVIPHHSVVLDVEASYPVSGAPMEDVPAYLFTEAGAYQGIVKRTDAAGQAAFWLPEQSYQVRVDHLGYPYWSEPFTGLDSTLTIDYGAVQVYATQGGAAVSGARVYLFNEQGAYQGWSEVTDAGGAATFTLPARPYRFRVDMNGTQTWSGVVSVEPGMEGIEVIDILP